MSYILERLVLPVGRGSFVSVLTPLLTEACPLVELADISELHGASNTSFVP